MMNWLNSILEGLKIYGAIAPTVAAILVIIALASKKLNIVSFFTDQLAVAYMIIVLMLVFFPLPDAEKAATLCTYHGRFLPGSFISDIAKERSLESVLQVLFNIVMTIPFGMILSYRFGFDKKNVILVSFLFSLFIEVGQLTGLFFTYGGSYRLFDADDLICNTLGGFIGFMVINKVKLPAIASFTVSLKRRVAVMQ